MPREFRNERSVCRPKILFFGGKLRNLWRVPVKVRVGGWGLGVKDQGLRIRVRG
jgi:hypothetical protein